MLDDEHLKLSTSDGLLDGLFEIEKGNEPVTVLSRNNVVKARPNMTIVLGRLIAVAEAAEVDAQIYVERLPPLRSLEVENADGFAIVLPPGRSRLLEVALLECWRKSLLQPSIVLGSHGLVYLQRGRHSNAWVCMLREGET